ncbi:hypothetical protein AX16_005693 [Volvariella volvacea WC 439]|nr:hypothetical protein AX16_005693 [Volvariella volvacea WC 439]
MADSDPSHQLDEQRKLEEQQPKPSPEVEEQVEEGSAQGVVGGDEDREPPEFEFVLLNTRTSTGY